MQLLSTPPNGYNTSLVPTRAGSRLHSRESNETPSQLGSSSPDSRQPLKVPTGFSKISTKFLFTVSTRVVRPGIFDIAVWTADVTAWLTAAIRDCAVKDTSTDASIPRKCISVPFAILSQIVCRTLQMFQCLTKENTNMCTNRLKKEKGCSITSNRLLCMSPKDSSQFLAVIAIGVGHASHFQQINKLVLTSSATLIPTSIFSKHT